MGILGRPSLICNLGPRQVAVARTITIPAIVMVVMVLVSAAVLFARLGHYSLWTDEAITAITAHGVWQTGDTTAWLNDHNLLTYRDGLLLKNQKDRYTSPLQFYWAAPFIGLLGNTDFACRLPFALCGFGTVMLLICWLGKAGASDGTWIAAAVILLCNASFFLFQRQCRYFALATFLTMLVAYLYCNWNGRRGQLFFIAAAMSLLLCAQYLDYAAVVACLFIDYGIWGRRRRAIRGINWIILILPQVLMMAVVCPIWNPIARAASAVAVTGPASGHAITAPAQPWIHGFLIMVWWNLRDMLACDFAIVPLLVICPLLYIQRKNAWLLRAPLALVVFLGAIAFFTAHPVNGPGNAEVRYLAPLLPLCIGIGILSVWGMQALPSWSRASLLLIAAGSTFVSLGIFSDRTSFRSSALSFYGELLHPAAEPYAPVSDWIHQNVQPRATVYVCPDCCVSSTMWKAPAPTYVWQLSDPPKSDYAALPAIYFKGRIAPDYVIVFGPYLDEAQYWQSQIAANGVRYQQVAAIPTYYKEMFRPELIWRSFTTITPAPGEEVYIFHRIR